MESVSEDDGSVSEDDGSVSEDDQVVSEDDPIVSEDDGGRLRGRSNVNDPSDPRDSDEDPLN